MQSSEKGSILVIEDDHLLRSLFCSYLDDENMPFIEKGDSLDVLDTIANQLVEVVLLDIMLPHKDGFATIRELKSAMPLLPVIAMSSSKSYLQIARSIGANDVLLKPFRREEMFRKIERLTRRVAA